MASAQPQMPLGQVSLSLSQAPPLPPIPPAPPVVRPQPFFPPAQGLKAIEGVNTEQDIANLRLKLGVSDDVGDVMEEAARRIGVPTVTYVARMLAQHLRRFNIDPATPWEGDVARLALQVATSVSPDLRQGQEAAISHYIKMKKLPGATPRECECVYGIVITKDVMHRHMPRYLREPKIVLLGFELGLDSALNIELAEMDDLLKNESAHFSQLVDALSFVRPDIVVCQHGVNRRLLTLLLRDAGVKVVVQHVKRSVLERMSRDLHCDISLSLEELKQPRRRLGICTAYRVDTYASPLLLGHRKTLMRFEVNPLESPACTLILRGARFDVLQRVKHVLLFGIAIAYTARFESAFFMSLGVRLFPAVRKPKLVTRDTPGASPISIEISDSIRPYYDTVFSSSYAVRFRPPIVLYRTLMIDRQLFEAKLKMEEAKSIAQNRSDADSLDKAVHAPSSDADAAAPSAAAPSAAPTTAARPSAAPTTSPANDYATLSDDENPRSTSANSTLVSPESDHTQTTPQTADSNSHSLVSLEQDALSVAYSDELEAKMFQLERLKTSFKHRIHMWRLYLETNDDSLDPVDHQNLIVLEQKSSARADVAPCIHPHLRSLRFFHNNDTSLGLFIENRCESAGNVCSSCHLQDIDHRWSWVHESLRVRLYSSFHGSSSISSVDEGVTFVKDAIKNGEANISHAAICPVCGQSTEYATGIMSTDMWRVSFGKFLELLFYIKLSGVCPHHHDASTSHILIRLGPFEFHFVTEPIILNDVYMPPLKLMFKPEQKLERCKLEYASLLAISGDVFTQIESRLSAFNAESCVRPAEAEQTLQSYIRVSRAQRISLIDTYKQAYFAETQNETSHALIDARRRLQGFVTQWHKTLRDLPRRFPQSSGRLAASNLQRLFSPMQQPEKEKPPSLSPATATSQTMHDHDSDALSEKSDTEKSSSASQKSPALRMTPLAQNATPTRKREPSSIASFFSADPDAKSADNTDTDDDFEHPSQLTLKPSAIASDSETTSSPAGSVRIHDSLPRSPHSRAPPPMYPKFIHSALEKNSLKKTHPFSGGSVQEQIRYYERLNKNKSSRAAPAAPIPPIRKRDMLVSSFRQQIVNQQRRKTLGPRSPHTGTDDDSGGDDENNVGLTYYHRHPFSHEQANSADADDSDDSDQNQSNVSFAAVSAAHPVIRNNRRYLKNSLNVRRAPPFLSKSNVAPRTSRPFNNQDRRNKYKPAAIDSILRPNEAKVSEPAVSSAGESVYAVPVTTLPHRKLPILDDKLTHAWRLSAAAAAKAPAKAADNAVASPRGSKSPSGTQTPPHNHQHEQGGEQSASASPETSRMSIQQRRRMQEQPPHAELPERNLLIEGLDAPMHFQDNKSRTSQSTTPLRTPLIRTPFDTEGSEYTSGSQQAHAPVSPPSNMGTVGTSNTFMRALSNMWTSSRSDGLEDSLHPSEHLYDDNPCVLREEELSSIIAFALSSNDYYTLLKDKTLGKGGGSSSHTGWDSAHTISNAAASSLDAPAFSNTVSGVPMELDPNLGNDPQRESIDIKEERFEEGDDRKKVPALRFSCKVHFADKFHKLRQWAGCEEQYLHSLARCIEWNTSGGKSKMSFLKTRDDRFIIKELSRFEIEAVSNFTPHYFDYMAEVYQGRPSVMGKIFGFYTLDFKSELTGMRMSGTYLVMENMFYEKTLACAFDLKGSSRNRYATPAPGQVLMDENLIEMSYTNPLYVHQRAKRRLRDAVHNDTLFLSSMNVMDYSLIVGIAENDELVVGLVDFIRTYTWDKKLESWVKDTAFLGSSYAKPGGPTIVTPKQYKNRFRRAMDAYFLLSPNPWLKESSDLMTNPYDHIDPAKEAAERYIESVS